MTHLPAFYKPAIQEGLSCAAYHAKRAEEAARRINYYSKKEKLGHARLFGAVSLLLCVLLCCHTRSVQR